MNQKEIARLLSGLIDGGLVLEKQVKNCTPTSGAIYLPKKLIGNKYRVFLVPIIDKPVEVENSVAKEVPEREPLKPIEPEKIGSVEAPSTRVKIDTSLTEMPE